MRTQDNLVALLGFFVVAIIAGLITSCLFNIASILGWIFVLLVPGFLFFMGENFVQIGYFNSIGWKSLFFVLIVPVVLFESYLTKALEWHNSFLISASYIICSLGVLLKKYDKNVVLDNFYENIEKYKIVNKYDDDPKWAIYLYFKSGEEGWNKTISGSFCAKDPENDLTFVFFSEKEASDYAQREFKNATYVKNENAS